jgi:hypothetical protein
MEIAGNRKPDGFWITWPMCSFLPLRHKKDLMLQGIGLNSYPGYDGGS